LVDTLDLVSSAFGRVGSSPSSGTNNQTVNMLTKLKQWAKNVFSKPEPPVDFNSLTEDELEKLLVKAILEAIKDGTFTEKHLNNKWVRKYFSTRRLNK
jgi:hypothetical protein